MEISKMVPEGERVKWLTKVDCRLGLARRGSISGSTVGGSMMGHPQSGLTALVRDRLQRVEPIKVSS